MENKGVCIVPVLRVRVKGALLVLPFRVYKLTVYVVPGCKPEGETQHGVRITGEGHFGSSVGVRCTLECVGVCVSGDGPCDGGVCAAAGCGGDQVAGDGFFFGTPGQGEGVLLFVGNAHAARGTNFCVRTEKRRRLFPLGHRQSGGGALPF